MHVMAHYLVEARVRADLAPLRRELDTGSVRTLRPFGPSLDHSLRNARRTPDGTVIWEELDFCSPPLAQERKALLDRYFEDIRTTPVAEGDGWKRIEAYPSVWD